MAFMIFLGLCAILLQLRRIGNPSSGELLAQQQVKAANAALAEARQLLVDLQKQLLALAEGLTPEDEQMRLYCFKRAHKLDEVLAIGMKGGQCQVFTTYINPQRDLMAVRRAEKVLQNVLLQRGEFNTERPN